MWFPTGSSAIAGDGIGPGGPSLEWRWRGGGLDAFSLVEANEAAVSEPDSLSSRFFSPSWALIGSLGLISDAEPETLRGHLNF